MGVWLDQIQSYPGICELSSSSGTLELSYFLGIHKISNFSTGKYTFDNANYLKLCATKLFRFQWPIERILEKSFGPGFFSISPQRGIKPENNQIRYK